MSHSAVIIALDGTLTNALEDMWLSTNHALRRMGKPQRSIDEVRAFVGNGIGNLIRRTIGQDAPERDYERCLAIFREHYVKHCFDHTRLYDGIDPLLHSLKARGVRVGITSNKLQAGVDELHGKYFRGLVDIAIGEREGMRRKPAPDMVEAALVALGAGKEECLYVGDSEVDILTARNAGLRCVSVLWGFRHRGELEAAGATTFVASPAELLPFFGG